ncbi:exosome complex exonuclease DIS3/RRP44 [Nematocida minor]|uniref:exosome complex exonuclease DIS3/RRP44 n=1 Tax=Nematocida minor TaxID=1912983 RepID=UPI00221F8212|nr:exosome complex exonuclease DIS3/RRP44 [Nematocida minor]KAI5190997.1 exosome complex exonuclease DIS3/RRP44 [Nematocida minor]
MERINISYKKTKKNEIYRAPQEIYLHDAVNCGFGCCSAANPRIREYLQKSNRFYILSDEFIHDFIHFIEEKALTNIIITRTAISELKRKYLNTFRRLERIIDRHNLPLIEDLFSKSIYEFTMEHTGVDYYEVLSMWYARHVAGCEFLPVHSIRETGSTPYPPSLFVYGSPGVLPETRIKAETPYTPYMEVDAMEEIQDRIEMGSISIPDSIGNGEIVCNIEGNQMRISIPREFLNRAIDKDYVFAEIVEETEDKSIGRVVGIEKRSRKPFPCTVLRLLNSTHALMEPEMNNLPMVICRVPENKDLKNRIYLVVVEEWNETEEYPIGYIIKETGEKGAIEAETAALLAHHSILDQPFETAALEELPSESWDVTPQDLAEREDLRAYPIASIDPEGCIDIDDALHAVERPNGIVEIGVHIADVTHFVKEGSHLDREGRIRGCTTYLPNRRIDMLPGLLGTNLCSLHKNVDRLAFSIIWEAKISDEKIEFISRRFAKTIIRSKESFTYDQASSVLETGRYKSQELIESLRILKKASTLLKKARLETGAFVIHSDECRISARNNKYFSEIAENPREHIISEEDHGEEHDTHSLVEEFMLLANQHVAEYISSVYPKESLIRVHPRPAALAFKQLENALSFLSSSPIVLDPNNPSELSATIKKYSSSPELKSAIGAWATKCMTQAVYAPSSIGSKLHYGLAMHNYTHFTSPIRRYADVIVHRILTHAINNDRYGPVTESTLEAICDSVNRSYRSAKWVSRHANDLYVRYLIASNTVNLVIIGISKEKIEVYLPYYGVTGELRLSEECSADSSSIVRKDRSTLHLFSTVRASLIPEIKKVFAFRLAG